MARDPRESRSAERAPSRGERAPLRKPDPSADRTDEPALPPGLFEGGSPREILNRLLDGDPLRIGDRTRAQLKDTARLIDPERWTLRSMARVAFAAPRWDKSGALGAWIDAQIERAAKDLLDEDRAALIEPAVAGEDEARHAFLVQALGIEPEIALKACVVFNELPFQVRRAFWALVVEGKSMGSCVSEGLGSRKQVRADVRRALSALSQLSDPGAAGGEGGQDD